MASKEQQAEKAARLAASRRPAVGAVPAAEPEVLPVVRTQRAKPIRQTVDLPPAMHTELNDYARRVALDGGLVRVYPAEVIKELLRELAEDADLASRVARRVVQRQQSR